MFRLAMLLLHPEALAPHVLYVLPDNRAMLLPFVILLLVAYKFPQGASVLKTQTVAPRVY